MNVCGEGGEYETLTLDCPLFKAARIVVDSSAVIRASADGSGVLRVTAFHTERKEGSLPGGEAGAGCGADENGGVRAHGANDSAGSTAGSAMVPEGAVIEVSGTAAGMEARCRQQGNRSSSSSSSSEHADVHSALLETDTISNVHVSESVQNSGFVHLLAVPLQSTTGGEGGKAGSTGVCSQEGTRISISS